MTPTYEQTCRAHRHDPLAGAGVVAEAETVAREAGAA